MGYHYVKTRVLLGGGKPDRGSWMGGANPQRDRSCQRDPVPTVRIVKEKVLNKGSIDVLSPGELLCREGRLGERARKAKRRLVLGKWSANEVGERTPIISRTKEEESQRKERGAPWASGYEIESKGKG